MQKGIVAAVAATMANGIVAPVFAASAETTDLASKYAKAYEATANAKTQKDLTAARKLVDALYVEVKGTANEYLATTLSQILDQPQQKNLELLDAAIKAAETAGTQEKINAARALLVDMPEVWAKAFSSYVDGIQNTLLAKADAAIKKAQASGLEADFNTAKALVAELATATNNDTVKTWAEVALKAELDKVVVNAVVKSVTATNLKEIVIEFTAKVDADTAKNVANYKLDGAALVTTAGSEDKLSLSEDGKTVKLTLGTAFTANQKAFEVTVKGVKDINGKEIAETKVKATAFDVTIPAVVKAEQNGPTGVKLTFSEPVQKPAATTFKLDDGKYFIDGTSVAQPAPNVITFNLYTTLPEGEHKVNVNGVKDWAQYGNVSTDLTFVASKDATAPTLAKVVKATPEQVIIEFSEDVTIDSAATTAGFYHTNANNVVKTVPTLVSGTTNQISLDFSTNKLPNGTAYLYIAKDMVKDAWSNKNVAIETAINVTADKVKPEIKEVKATDDKNILITYTEDIDNTNAVYKLLDASGAEVTGNTVSIAQPTDSKGATIKDQVKLTYTTALSGSAYTVVVEKVKDLAGNEIDKVSKTISVTDTTAPLVKDLVVTTPDTATNAYLYGSAKIVKIGFNEVMNADDLLNLDNYMLGSKYLSAYKVSASIADSGKAVLLDFSKEDTVTLANGDSLLVGRVRDAVGNKIAALQSTVVLVNQDTTGIAIDNVQVTGTKTVKVTLKDALSAFEANDFILEDSDANAIALGSVEFNNVDSKGVITFTLANELTTDAKTLAGKTLVVKTDATAANINSKNAFGVKVANAATFNTIQDKVAPVLTKYDHDNSATTANVEQVKWNAGKIELTFSEDIKAATVSTLTFAVQDYDVTAVTVTGSVVSLTVSAKAGVTTPAANPKVTQVYNITDLSGNAFVSGGEWTTR